MQQRAAGPEYRRVADQVVAPQQHVSAGGRLDDDLLRAFVEATEALVCIVDGDGRILLANRALQRFTGRSADELHGQWFWDVFVAPEHVVLAQDAVERAMASGTAHPQEGDWLTADGERRRVAMRNTVLRDDDGLPYAIACVGLDVTDDRRREELLHQRAQTDLLTGIANRGALFDALHRRLEEGSGCALLFCDLDQFKEVNDEHGHAVGDRILAEVAARLVELAGAGRPGGPVRRRRVRHPLPGRTRSALADARPSGWPSEVGAPVPRPGGPAVARGQRRASPSAGRGTPPTS